MTASSSRPRVDVVVVGHRDLYGTPRAIDRAGLLRYLVTDHYVGKGSPLSHVRQLLRFGPKSIRKLLSRDSGLPAEKIIANNIAGLRSWNALRKPLDPGAASVLHQRLAKELAQSLLRRCPPFADAVVGYRMSDWLFSQLPANTAKILCQNDGGAHEVEVVGEVYNRNPEWHMPAEKPQATVANEAPDWLEVERTRLKEEWRLSSRIVCWSEWCVTCVTADGVPREKCVVVPPLFTPSPAYAACEPDYHKQPFTIIFLGTLCLRKGTHDLVQAVARAADQVPVRLVLAGPNQLNPAMLERYKNHIDYRGFVPHNELPGLFKQGHLLALPSYSEGFGMVQLEAMAAGLPVIRSTNTGEAARDGEEGIVVTPGDPAAITEAIVRLARDRGLLRDMGINARRRVNDFSIDTGAAAWDAVVQGVVR